MTMCKEMACIVHVYRPACTCIYIVHVHKKLLISTWFRVEYLFLTSIVFHGCFIHSSVETPCDNTYMSSMGASFILVLKHHVIIHTCMYNHMVFQH